MRRLTFAALLALTGCQVVVDDIEPPACTSSAQCAILNQLEGIPEDACELYQCQGTTCRLGVRDLDNDGHVAPECASLAPDQPIDCNDAVPDGIEVCNGIDDDCDGTIDELWLEDGVFHPVLPARAAQALFSSNASDTARPAYGASRGAVAIAYADSGAGTLGLVSGDAVSGPSTMSFARAVSLGDVVSGGLEPGCHVYAGDGPTFDEAACRFDELALALTGENVFVTSISRTGCSAGQLRVGYSPRAELGAVIERGPWRRSNAFAGVDVDTAEGALPCTGGSRPEVRGAARPSVAAMDLTGARDQALAAWIADGFERPECGGTEADVEVLGLHVQTAPGDAYGWVTASGEGAPQVVGRTTQGGRPAVATWDNTGYVVAFASVAGIELVFVEMMGSPPPFAGGDANDRTGLETPPLVFRSAGTIGEAGADDVAIALGSIRSGGIDVGVTWREGCGTGTERVRFRQVFITRDGSIDLARSFDDIELSAGPTRSVGPPAIAYTFRGMFAPGVERETGPARTDANDGGWFVAWMDGSMPDGGPVDDTRIVARRVSEADGAIVNHDELIVLSRPGDVRHVRPALYTDADDRVHYAFLATGPEGAFQGGPLTCLP